MVTRERLEERRARLLWLAENLFACPAEDVTDPQFRLWWELVKDLLEVIRD